MSTSSGLTADLSRRVGWRAILAFLVATVALAIRIPGLGQALIEWHAWRQTWTAWTAVIFHQQGIDLLHPQVPVFGPPFEVPVEFPAVQALAALVMDVGVTPDVAMRLTHLALFAISAALLYRLIDHVAGPVAAMAGDVYFLFAPVNILFSRASLTEFGATAGALAFLYGGLLWREQRSRIALVVALTAGCLAMLVKPSTALFWPVALVLWVPRSKRDIGRRPLADAGVILLCVLPLVIGLAWTAWADAIKAPQEAAAFHTSAGMRTFYFATLAERLDPSLWARDLTWLTLLVVGLGALPIAVLGLLTALRSGQRKFWLGLAAAASLPVATFYGGYWRHDYYWTALTPEIACFIGLGVAALISATSAARTRVLVAPILGLALATSLFASYDYWTLIYPPVHDPPGLLPRARELAAHTAPDDVVVIIGREFNSDLSYYAQRRALMLTAENWSDHLVGSLPEKGYAFLFSWTPEIDAISIMNLWEWSAAVAPHLYALGTRPADLGPATLLGTDDASALPADARLISDIPVSLTCDGSVQRVRAGSRGTWFRVRPNPAVRITVSPELAPMLARRLVFVDSGLAATDSRIELTCSGAAAMEIEAIYDAPPTGGR